MHTQPQEFARSGFNLAAFFVSTTFDGVERLAQLNLAAARSMLEVSFANLNVLLGARDVQSLIALQKTLAVPTLEKGMAYSRDVIAIANDTKGKIATEVELQVTETQAKVNGLVDKALATAPAGSEVAVAALKSAMKTANEAYEGLNKAVRQAADIAEAGVATATEATLKAANLAVVKQAA